MMFRVNFFKFFFIFLILIQLAYTNAHDTHNSSEFKSVKMSQKRNFANISSDMYIYNAVTL